MQTLVTEIKPMQHNFGSAFRWGCTNRMCVCPCIVAYA